jgi:uncharacterized protein (DUF305 family)
MTKRICTVGVIGALTLIAACSRSDGNTTDTATGAVATTPVSETGTTGRPPAKDGDHEFLRMMTDHHEGLVRMATAAMTKASQTTTQGDAHQLHTKQADEQKKMTAMVQSMYAETLTPMLLPQHQAMIDSLNAKSGAEYDRTFYRNVIAHHREGLRMADEHMAHLTKPEVKQMAERMKADQQKEITEFERKARG